MSRTLPFSIIVLNWNGKNWLKKCFESIKLQSSKTYEVILTDNGSVDGSVEFVNKNYSFVRILENEKNLGYTGANNRAARIARGRYLIFINNDTWFEPDFIQKMLNFLEDNPNAKLIASLILGYEETDPSKHIVFTGLDRFSYPSVSPSHFYVDGCCFIIEAKLFRLLGGFDSRYFIFLEDVDLSWRAQIAGERLYYNCASVIHHECGGTVVGSMDKGKGRHKTSYNRRYLSERNSLCNVIKNYELRNVLWIVPIHMCLGLAEAFLYLITGKFRAFIAIIRAIFWNVINIKSTLEIRQKIQSMRKVPDSDLFKRMEKGIGKWRAFCDIGGIPEFS